MSRSKLMEFDVEPKREKATGMERRKKCEGSLCAMSWEREKGEGEGEQVWRGRERREEKDQTDDGDRGERM
jgi:hypothetical protein